MAVLHRALFTWFNLLIFLILLVLRLDQRIQWNWFIVFIPMWLYDHILLVYIVFNMISHCKNGRVVNLRREVWYMTAVFMKLSAQILICLKLEAPHWFLPAKVVLAPFWILLPALAVDVFGVHGISTVTVTEVPAGHLAELPCLSSDDYHRFMFWQLKDDHHIIGPGNPMDENKYNYEVLTGKLFIKSVSTAESGFYRCISKGIADHSAINIHSVELVVKKDWEDVWENDFETNLLRGMAAVMVVVVAIAIVLFIITTKRKRNHRFFDLEESRENSPEKYTPNVNAGPAVSAPTIEVGGIDNTTLDIDFPRVFKQMQK